MPHSVVPQQFDSVARNLQTAPPLLLLPWFAVYRWAIMPPVACLIAYACTTASSCCCCLIDTRYSYRSRGVSKNVNDVLPFESVPGTFFFNTSINTFQLLNKPWSQVSFVFPPGSCLQFSSRIGFSNPTTRRLFIECLLLTHALAFSASPRVHKKKSPRIYTRVDYALGGIRTHETDLYHARG